MAKQHKIILASIAVVIAGIVGWACMKPRDPKMYGGIEAYMKELRKLHKETAAEMAKAGDALPADFVPMEKLAQSCQDIYGVFANEAAAKSPAFVSAATELMRNATQLEQAWDAPRPADARAAMEKLTAACNSCHTTVGEGKPPKISFSK